MATIPRFLRIFQRTETDSKFASLQRGLQLTDHVLYLTRTKSSADRMPANVKRLAVSMLEKRRQGKELRRRSLFLEQRRGHSRMGKLM